jgi:hypothetical protein
MAKNVTDDITQNSTKTWNSIAMPVTEAQKRVDNSFNRSYNITAARVKNIEYAQQLKDWRQDVVIDDSSVNGFLDRFHGSLCGCSSHGLYRSLNGSNHVTLIGTKTCDHRLCSVCNALRAKMLRRKYWNFFSSEEQNVKIYRKHFDHLRHEIQYTDITNGTGKDQRILRSFYMPVLQDEKTTVAYTEAKIKEVATKAIELASAKVQGLPVQKKTKQLTQGGKLKAYKFSSGKEILESVDLMHLTLTVPHNNGSWNGKEFYAKELINAFTKLRKCEWWSDLVFGGEYTTEVKTSPDKSGLHIHIHALLLVKKQRGSRNELYKNIMVKWNQLTVDRGGIFFKKEDLKRQFNFSPDRLQGLRTALRFLKPVMYDRVIKCKEKVGNKVKTVKKIISSVNDLPDNYDPYFDKALQPVFSKLDSRGSTLVGLKSLYYEVSADAYNSCKGGKFMQDGRFFRYSGSNNLQSVMKGVLECLKYHFEPCSIENENGELNCEILPSLLPNIYRQRLYGKFGALYGLSQLNVMEEALDTADEMLQDAAEVAKEAFHPVTGLPIERSEYSYVVADAAAIVYDRKKKQYYLDKGNIKKTIEPESSQTMKDAIIAFVKSTTEDMSDDRKERTALEQYKKIEHGNDTHSKHENKRRTLYTGR